MEKNRVGIGESELLQRHKEVLVIWDMMSGDTYPVLKYVSDNVSAYGYSAQAHMEGRVNWIDMVHVEDRPRVEHEGSQFLLKATGRLVQEYRIVTKTGEILWVQADSCYMKAGDADSAYVETVIRNIDASKRRERELLENQRALQNEIFTYMDAIQESSFEENLTDFIKEQRIETLQAAFAEIYGIHAALISRDYHFYTRMTGPRAEAGIFYDVAELRDFRRKIAMLEEMLEAGQRHVILSMQNPNIKITGVPVFHKKEYVATWVLCCLEEKKSEDILKVLEYMRIMAETISGHYRNHVSGMSAKGYAFERYRLQKQVLLQGRLLEIYGDIQGMELQQKLMHIMKAAGETTACTRCALYEALQNSVYARCMVSWMQEHTSFNLMERELYSVQALPNPGVLLQNEAVVLNSIHVPREWQSTMNDLYASAAVLIPVKWSGKTGFLAFLEIGEERVWEEEAIWFLKEIKKIIEKVLLKSE